MRELILKIDGVLEGRKIRHLVKNELGISSGLYRRLKRTEGAVTLDGRDTYADETVREGQTLVIRISDTTSENIEPADIPLEIIYEDEDILIVNKPRSMPTHPSMHHHGDTLANGVMNYYKNREFTFRVITRLDKDTSGVVLIAKNAFSAQRLCKFMAEGKFVKEYVALVCGVPSQSSGRIDAPIKRKEESVILRCVSQDGKQAVSNYEVIETDGSFSLVKLIPETGRTHQLRVHMSYMGTPIYGDAFYGNGEADGKTRLHCRRLMFPHPVDERAVTAEAEIPQDMNNIITIKDTRK